MEFGSVCSGIEAASVAWHALEWRAAWLAEVDRGASEVLAFRFPEVPNHGDMLALAGKVRRREIPAPDILVGGTPCQSFSVAGMRRGLADARGNLAIAYIDLANAIDEVRQQDGKEPCIVVFENVPGLLSSKDNAFGCFLAGLAGESDEVQPAGRKWTHAGCVFGPQRAIAWRTLDAQFFGLAQRRRRVFVVASAMEGFDPAAILFEWEGVRRDSAPSRQAREDVTHAIAPCLTSSGRGVERTGDPRGQDAVIAVGVRPAAGSVAYGGGNQSGPIEVATALTCNERYDFDSETFLVEPLAFQQNSRDEVRLMGGDGNIAGSLCAEPGTRGTTTYIAFSSKDYGGDATQDLSPTLRAGGHTESHANAGVMPAVAYAFQPRIARNGRGDMGDVVNALTAQAGETGKGDAAPCVALGFYHTNRQPEFGNYEEVSPALKVGSGGASGNPPAVCITGDITHTLKAEGFDASEDGTGRGQPITPMGMAVRRLMPVECERLQGFPDGWTLVPTGPKRKPAADGPRYKQLGNSMAVNCMRWIGARIKQHLADIAPTNDDFDSLLMEDEFDALIA